VPGYRLALTLGVHHSALSALINADVLPATHMNVERLERIADAVNFNRAELFLDGDAA
jgi:hypothetical protein